MKSVKKIMAKESSNIQQGVATFEYNPADAQQPFLFELSRPLDDLGGMLLSGICRAETQDVRHIQAT